MKGGGRGQGRVPEVIKRKVGGTGALCCPLQLGKRQRRVHPWHSSTLAKNVPRKVKGDGDLPSGSVNSPTKGFSLGGRFDRDITLKQFTS